MTLKSQSRTESVESLSFGTACGEIQYSGSAHPGRHPDRSGTYPERNLNETENGFIPPPDLAGIVAAWPSIPEQIKQAVKAVLAPYIKEGDE